jgi:hypothetical protein
MWIDIFGEHDDASSLEAGRRIGNSQPMSAAAGTDQAGLSLFRRQTAYLTQRTSYLE